MPRSWCDRASPHLVHGVVIAVAVAVIVVSIAYLARVKPSEVPTVEQFVAAEELAPIKRIREGFESQEGGLVVGIEVAAPELLSRRLEAYESALRGIDGIDRTWSFQTRPRLRVTDEQPSRLAVAHGGAAAEPGAFRLLLQPRPNIAVILAELAPSTGSLGGSREIVSAIGNEFTKIRQPGEQVSVLGPPVLRAASWDQVRQDLGRLLPFLVIVVIAVPVVLFRSLMAALFPLVLAAATTATTLALYALSVGTVTPLVVALVPLLWSVATLDALHLYHRVCRKGSHERAVQAATRELWWPCIATTATTAGGLLMLAAVGQSPLLRTFGLWGAVGSVIAFVTTFAVGGALLAVVRRRSAGLSWGSQLTRRLVQASCRKAGWVVSGWCVVGVVCLCCVPQLQARFRYPRIFVSEHPTAQQIDRLAEALGTDLLPLEIYLEPKVGRSPGIAALVSSTMVLTGYLHTIDETVMALSPALLIAELRRDDPRARKLLRGHALMHDLNEHGHSVASDPYVRSWIDVEGGRGRVQLHLAATSLARKIEIIEWIRAFGAKNLPDYQLVIGGAGFLYARAEQDGIDGVLAGGAWTAALVFFAFVVTFRRRRLVLVAVVGNVTPLLVVGAAMVWIGIDWSLGLLAVPVVLAGLCVDDTLHLLWPLRRGEAAADAALDQAASDSGPALVATSILVAACFGALITSGLVVNKELGMLFVAGIGSALACDLTLVPALLCLPVPRRGSVRSSRM